MNRPGTRRTIALMLGTVCLFTNADVHPANSLPSTAVSGQQSAYFIRNMGQWPDSILYRASSGEAFITKFDALSCVSSANIDGDSMTLTSADMQALQAFVNGTGPAPNPLYEGDLNADGYIDQLDVEKYRCYFIFGMTCFPQFPVPVGCDPDTARAACCYPYTSLDSCVNLAHVHCPFQSIFAAPNGTYCNTFRCRDFFCCAGLTGNVDCDPADGVDISDLAGLIDHLYISFTPLCCDKEANTDGQPGIDIADLSALIDYLYISFTPPAACQ